MSTINAKLLSIGTNKAAHKILLNITWQKQSVKSSATMQTERISQTKHTSYQASLHLPCLRLVRLPQPPDPAAVALSASVHAAILKGLASQRGHYEMMILNLASMETHLNFHRFERWLHENCYLHHLSGNNNNDKVFTLFKENNSKVLSIN